MVFQMSNSFVVDTNVLVFAETHHHEKRIDAVCFVTHLWKNSIIALDAPFGVIFKQYKNNLPNTGFVFDIILRMMSKANKVTFGKRALPRTVSNDLNSPPMFDINDLIFIEVAYATRSNIVTEDIQSGDFDSRVKNTCKENIGIDILTILEANNTIMRAR